jgi:hypothetical protein
LVVACARSCLSKTRSKKAGTEAEARASFVFTDLPLEKQ